MRIRVLGGGWYGCHIALGLLGRGHEVELHEIAQNIFAGASGGNPARLHMGFHYPRSRLTRAACQEHADRFLEHYGALTRVIPVNIYAVAARDSLMDFGTYRQVLQGEVEFVTIKDPHELGLTNVEGALLTGERHIIIDEARERFKGLLNGHIRYEREPGLVDSPDWDWTIDCTFCALDAENVDRYEPCVTVLLEGPTYMAVTIMDGPFPSIYPWDEGRGLSSLTSASLTPLSKTCRTWAEAKAVLDDASPRQLYERSWRMVDQMAQFWPSAPRLYKVAGHKLSIRAMPRSGADARLVDVVPVGERALRVRAGKIDAVFHAEAVVAEKIGA